MGGRVWDAGSVLGRSGEAAGEAGGDRQETQAAQATG